MTAKTLAMVALGGAIGASLRYLVVLWMAGTAGRGEFPWGTLTVNLVGTAILALLTALVLSGREVATETQLLVGTGFCGALTTFSTVAVELVMLVRAGATMHAITYAATSVLASLVIVIAVFHAFRVLKA